MAAQGSLLEFLPAGLCQKWKNCECHDHAERERAPKKIATRQTNEATFEPLFFFTRFLVGSGKAEKPRSNTRPINAQLP